MSTYIRQAVVVIHGMGEQRPLSTVLGFIDNALEPAPDVGRTYYSRPESVTGSYESRRFLAPPRTVAGPDGSEVEVNAQTEFFEYHWSHLMQGNKLADLAVTVRQILFLPIARVPYGLVWAWLVAWLLVLGAVWAFVWGPWSAVLSDGDGDLLTRLIGTVLSGGALAAVVAFVVGKVLPAWLTNSFVDVTRYLDTSPRSYAARKEIRQGLVELLQRLHDAKRGRSQTYDRIIVVGHSLGSYIAFDAISYLWAQHNGKHSGKKAPAVFHGLLEVEQSASGLPPQPRFEPYVPSAEEDAARARFRTAQREAWLGLREQGNPWRITDLVTAGSPMYFADRLIGGKGKLAFPERIRRGEQPTCPPQDDVSLRERDTEKTRHFSWAHPWTKRRILHEGAPFAVVRWTNLYYPARLRFFGDWFGGPLAPMYGAGIEDVIVTGNGPRGVGARLWRNRLVPGFAHSLYFDFPDDAATDSAATALRRAMDLAASDWVAAGPADGDDGQSGDAQDRDGQDDAGAGSPA